MPSDRSYPKLTYSHLHQKLKYPKKLGVYNMFRSYHLLLKPDDRTISITLKSTANFINQLTILFSQS